MDLPQSPPLFRRNHHHLRYVNILHHPDFISPPYPHHLPPPPPPPPQHIPHHILLPPPPPLPPSARHSGHLPFHPRFTFSPPRHPIIERSHIDEFDPSPKPYFDRTLLRSPLPPHPIENFPLRIIHDHSERNPIIRDENFPRNCVGNHVHDYPENWDWNLQLGGRELHTRVPGIDIDGHGKHRDIFNQSREFCIERNDSERWDSGISDWGGDVYERRDYDVRRWDNGMYDQGRELYSERDYDERRWDNGKLYCEGDDDERRWDSRSNEVLSQFKNRQPGFMENVMSLGRFRGRLRREASKRGVTIRCNKKKSALHRIQLGKECITRGYKHGHSRKRLRKGSFKGKGKGIERLQTRLEDNREREQSPVDLAISFKSNALVARAILAPSHPAFESDAKSMSLNKRLMDDVSGSPSAKSSKEVVLDLQSDLQKRSKDLQNKAAVSESRSVTANNAIDLGEGALENAHMKVIDDLQQPNIVRSVISRSSRLRRKKRARKQLIREANLQMDKNSDDIMNAKDCTNSQSSRALLNSDTTLSKGNLSSAVLGENPGSLPFFGGTISEKSGTCGHSYSPFVPKLKRKRVSLTTSASSCEDVITECSDHAERLITTTEDADQVLQLGADEVACHAHEKSLAYKNTCDCYSLGFNQHMNSAVKSLHDRASVLDAKKGAIEPVDRYAELGSDKVDDINEHSVLVGLMSLECPFVKQPSDVTVPNEGHYVAGLSRFQETRTPEVHEDKYFSENHERILSAKSDCSVTLMQELEDATMFTVGSKDANSKEFLLDQVIVPQVGIDAKEFRSSECAAVAGLSSSPVGFGTSLSHNIDSAEGSPEVISNGESCLSVDCLPKIIRKRKARGAQVGLSSTNCASTVKSINGKIARGLAADHVPALYVDFFCEKNSCNENDNLKEGPSRVEDLNPEVYPGASGLFTGFQKKLKLSSPRSSHSSFSEDSTIAEGETTNPPIPDQPSIRLAERGAEQREDTSFASSAVNQRGITNMEFNVGIDNSSIANLDENLDNDNKSHGNDDLASNVNNMSLCADINDEYSSDSSDELLVSGFDMRSWMSSPEQLLAYSDLNFTRKTEAAACLSENEMICGSGNMFKKKPLSADPNVCCLGKSLEAAVTNLHTNADIPPSRHEDTSQLAKKLNPVFGKLTWSRNQLTSAVPKVIPGHHPSNLSNSKKLYPIHATKSRTWHRTGNSSVVAEPKLLSSPVLQSHGTKAARTTQSSYVRKGNSLVRNPSVSGDTPPINRSSCSVYRRTPCPGTMKNSQLSDCKIGNGDATTLTKIGQINTSKMIKTSSLNQSGKSLSCCPCNSGEPLPVGNPARNSVPSKTLDSPEERIKTSLAPKRRTDSVTNSDSQGTREEGKSDKKIKYVKRRSNQLVATSNSDDSSVLGVDKNQASLSDGYYKSRQNQLVRASSKSHVRKGEANGNALRLVPRSVLPKTSNRRLSGFAKTGRNSKLSLVWKLHDAQSSEKEKNSLGAQKVWPHLFSLKRAGCWRSRILGTKSNNISFSSISQKLLLSRKRGAIYTRSTHGYSLRMSKVLSVGGSSLKWSKSIERNSKKANEDATKAVAAAGKRKTEEKGAATVASKSRNHVSRKLVPSVKLRPGERIFRIGSERYKMDPTRRTLHRITENEPSSSVALQSEKNVRRSYIPRRLLIGNEEYVRIGNGNQLVRDPKKRTRVLASEKVRWSIRTARLRLARKRRYCQFFTRFGKCNKDDGKCPYIHDRSKIVVCTKFLSGSCSNPDCKLTHKVIPERMQDCSYYLKGSCSNENCPYRHVNVDPDSMVCESFLRGYCADGNECRKKHTYICPAFEAKGICPQATTCKLHHPKKKAERKPTIEQNIVRGRYFDGGLFGLADCSEATDEKLPAKGKVDIVEGKYPDYISLDVSDDEVDERLDWGQASDDILPDAQISDLGIVNRYSLVDSSPGIDREVEMSDVVL